MTKFHFAAATAMIALLMAPQAQAHAKLLSSTPVDGATVTAPKQIVLKFSEKLQPKFSSVALTMPTMNNMTVATKVSVAKDRATMTATPAQPLTPDAYTASWHAVTADTHRMEGTFNFTVR